MPIEHKADKVEREHLIRSYITLQTDLLINVKGWDKEKAEAFVKKKVDELFKDKIIVNRVFPRYGEADTKRGSLMQHLKAINNKIITPSGSVYQPVYEKVSLVSEMVDSKLADRDVFKDKQLEAQGDGDDKTANKFLYAQANTKILVNSLPGGFGFEGNLFFDKGGYNAITSIARSVIAHAYTMAEQLVGGNFAWFNEADLLNHVITTVRLCPEEEHIKALANKFNLKIPSKEELLEFYYSTLSKYVIKPPMKTIRTYVSKLPWYKIMYLYYYNNLRHIFWNNEGGKGWVDNLLSKDGVVADPNVDPAIIKTLDHDLIPVICINLTKELNGVQFKDLPTKAPDTARYVWAYAERIMAKFAALDEILDTFVYNEGQVPSINRRKNMRRNTVIISDTDSVIFTTKEWGEWYCGSVEEITDPAYYISALVTYWLTKVTASALNKLSIQLGATGKNVYRMQMKNEFLYPTILNYGVKKTYAGIIIIQEGVVLPKPKTDLKGVQIRGSMLSVTTNKFVEDFLVNDILEPAMKGRIDHEVLIKRCVDFENRVRDSLLTGETTFLEMASVKTLDQYKSLNGQAVKGWKAWDEIFGPKYGKLSVPSKYYKIPINLPTDSYYEILREMDPELCKRFQRYVDREKKAPSAFMCNGDEVPKELIPLLAVRDIVSRNVNPLHLSMERLNITAGHREKKLLFSDVYRSEDLPDA